MTQRFYVLHLNPQSKGMTDRYSVMRLDDDGSLSPLWGEHIDADPCTPAWDRAGRQSAKAWPHMVYAPRPSSGPDRYPAFHFALKGYGYSKLYDLALSLAAKLGEDVELHSVTGWRSSVTRAEAPKEA